MALVACRFRLFPLVLLVAWGVSGCASLPAGLVRDAQPGPVAAPAPQAGPDAPVLAALDDVVAGEPLTLPDGVRITAGEAYAAASGRLCRRVDLGHADGRSQRRLACSVGGNWTWVPAATPDYGN